MVNGPFLAGSPASASGTTHHPSDLAAPGCEPAACPMVAVHGAGRPLPAGELDLVGGLFDSAIIITTDVLGMLFAVEGAARLLRLAALGFPNAELHVLRRWRSSNSAFCHPCPPTAKKCSPQPFAWRGAADARLRFSRNARALLSPSAISRSMLWPLRSSLFSRSSVCWTSADISMLGM